MSPWNTACTIWRLGVLQALCWSYADEMGRLVAHCSCCGRPWKVLTTVFTIQASSSSQHSFFQHPVFRLVAELVWLRRTKVSHHTAASMGLSGLMQSDIDSSTDLYVIFTEDVGQIPPNNSIAVWFLEVMLFNIGMNTPCTAWTSPKTESKISNIPSHFVFEDSLKKNTFIHPIPSASFPSTWIFVFLNFLGKGPIRPKAQAVSRYRELRDRSNEVFGIHCQPMVNGKFWGVWPPGVSGTKNGGTEPYKAILGMGFPLQKPYIQLI